MSLNFNNIMLGTDQKDRMVEFYTKVLGKPMMDEGGFTGWVAGDGFIMLGEHSEIHGKNPQPARCIWFFQTTDVDGEFKRIKELGAEVVKEPYAPAEGVRLATFADPDGNYFQLSTPWEGDK